MSQPTIRDQDYLLLRDGNLLAVHGHNHPPGHVIGELAFMPDGTGDYTFFGNGYRKGYVRNGRGLSERARKKVRAKTGTYFDHAHPFMCKSIVPIDDVELHLPAMRAMPTALASASPRGKYVRDQLGELRKIIGSHDRNAVGLTGSLRLMSDDQSGDFHDLDVVFEQEPGINSQIARSLMTHAQRTPASRVHEHGKGWRMRIRTSAGLLCPFFRYPDAEAAPLADVEDMTDAGIEVTVTGRVVDNTHGVYLPTMLVIKPNGSRRQLPSTLHDRLTVVIHHMRDRGDFALGDYGTFSGGLVHVRTKVSEHLILSVVDGADSRLETPPWRPY